jgi:protein SERAC1
MHSAGSPALDVVFVHGIRGGAFATWRREGVLARGAARDHLERSVCWPAAWLAPALPNARLISVDYAAPASGWEGESLPFEPTAEQLAAKLVAAGVGQRPVVFVTHSMGGLMVKGVGFFLFLV